MHLTQTAIFSLFRLDSFDFICNCCSLMDILTHFTLIVFYVIKLEKITLF